MIQIKRAYERGHRTDGYRVLVDRLWPRGIKKKDLDHDEWLKDLAPSDTLRKKFGHDKAHWKAFVSAYKKELHSPQSKELIQKLARQARRRTLTLLYGARNETQNNAAVLKKVIEKELGKSKH